MKKICLTLSILIGSMSSINGQTWLQPIKTLPLASPQNMMVSENSYYGLSVDMEEDIAVVGYPQYTDLNFQEGTVLLFERLGTQWIQIAQLHASDQRKLFGSTVAISGDVIVVGAVETATSNISKTGAVYVFSKPENGWQDMQETAILTVEDAESYSKFGVSVDISNEVIIAGANSVTDSNSDFQGPGSAYVFVKPENGWVAMSQTAKFSTSNGLNGDAFGLSVAIEDDVIVVGSPGADSQSGKVFIYEKPSDGWVDMSETAEIGLAFGTYLGESVAIDQEVIVVGAPRFAGFGGGNAYIFERPESGWTNDTSPIRLLHDIDGDRSFGVYVTIKDDVILVSDPNKEGGIVYSYTKPLEGWTEMFETVSIAPSDIEVGDFFGGALALSEQFALIGSPFDSEAASRSGATYFYQRHENIANVTASNEDDTYDPDSEVEITLFFSDVVTVTGSPRILLETGEIDRYANYVSGSGTNVLSFRYLVQNGDESNDLSYSSIDALELNNGEISVSGNGPVLTLPDPGSPGSLSANKNLVISPVITAVSNEKTANLILFPNPVGNQLNLLLPQKNAQKTEISIYDMAGKIVYQGTISTKTGQIELPEIQNGTYLLKAKNKSRTTVVRFIKK